LGFELSGQYAEQTKLRLQSIKPGDPLEGVADPVTSVPSTDKGRRLEKVKGP
jgi:hypothetical protein